jgi:membrane-associated protease RseP (regulator of RpoE activity)
MSRVLLVLAALLVCGLPAARGQSGELKSPGGGAAGSAKAVPPLGISFSAVPDVLYDHLRLPNLRRGHGVVVRDIAPDSPAADAGLEHNDILLSCNGTQIENSEQCVRLIQATAPEGKARLLLVRRGKEMRVRLRLATPLGTTPAPPPFAKAVIKPGGPPAISLKAEALDGGKLQVTFVYYSDGKGKLDQVTCSGSFREIETQVRDMGANNQIPPRVRELVDVALKRIRTLNTP